MTNSNDRAKSLTLPGVTPTSIIESHCILFSIRSNRGETARLIAASLIEFITFPCIARLYRAAQREEGHVRDARYSSGYFPRRILATGSPVFFGMRYLWNASLIRDDRSTLRPAVEIINNSRTLRDAKKISTDLFRNLLKRAILAVIHFDFDFLF